MLYSWRWLVEYQHRAVEGLEVCFITTPPQNKIAQRAGDDQEVTKRILKKINKVRERGYMKPGYVKSLISFFSVPKGEDDIRVVYNGTSSGLNDACWVPRFVLPTVETHLRQTEVGSWMADADIGEIFLNFPLHELLWCLCGVDLTLYVGAKEGKVWERWTRAAMGLKSSPYQCTQGVGYAIEWVLGDRSNPDNIFGWETVELNLPGMDHYDPSRAWVARRRKDGKLAVTIVIFVDNLRIIGNTQDEVWRACRDVISKLNYLGIQDAARKRRQRSLTPGAWAGCVIRTGDEDVTVMVSEEKWLKMRDMVKELEGLLEASDSLPRK